MGHTILELAKRKLKKLADIYPKHIMVERCENFHIHLRNLRLVFSRKEFETFRRIMDIAFKKWDNLGNPDPEPTKSLPEYLYDGYTDQGDPKFKAEHDELNDEFAIELQGNLPHMPKNMIHLHYRSLRLDISHEEFLKFADDVVEAKRKLLEYKEAHKL